MTALEFLILLCIYAPCFFMAGSALAAYFSSSANLAWTFLNTSSILALTATAVFWIVKICIDQLPLDTSALDSRWDALGTWMALLVQLLSTIIGSFSAKHLEEEAHQKYYIVLFSSIIAAVHGLLITNHWLIFVTVWSFINWLLKKMLCFYANRPFALLATYKKKFTDHLADGLLLFASILFWLETGNGSIAYLMDYISVNNTSGNLQTGSILFATAVILRTALMPMHGWLVQVMETPTPISALLHAGIINLGGFILVRFSPLIQLSKVACYLLIIFGLFTATLAGLVTLTRTSIKTRLAWSTVSQMGFMLLECGLGLYTLAMLHLLGHSFYKAHAFLSSSSIVRYSRRQAMVGRLRPSISSLCLAPLTSISTIILVTICVPTGWVIFTWPWWWYGVLALSWSPILWFSTSTVPKLYGMLMQVVSGVVIVAGLTLTLRLLETIPFEVVDTPNNTAGPLVLIVMGIFYLLLVVLQWCPEAMALLYRWSYFGFHMDEMYTYFVLHLFPVFWISSEPSSAAVVSGNTKTNLFKQCTPSSGNFDEKSKDR